MAQTVFWSWQGDHPARVTRDFVRDALLAALEGIAADFEEAERPEIDHDTRGVAGTPDIVATILEKIDAAAVFVADLTPIAVTERGKQVANPNVLLELGYAKKALGPERLVLVWNTALTNARPEDLPFDLRHRRAPIEFSLSRNADTNELRSVRRKLTSKLAEALRASLSTLNPQHKGPPWWPSESNEPSIWREANARFMVSAEEGAIYPQLAGTPRGYARLIPSHWQIHDNALLLLSKEASRPIPLGRTERMTWGAVRDGYLVFGSDASLKRDHAPTATCWFWETGELWGVASNFFLDLHPLYYSPTSALRCWSGWLRHSLRICQATGGWGPFHVILGLDNILDTYKSGGGVSRALESEVVHSFTLSDASPAQISKHISKLAEKIEWAYRVVPRSSKPAV